MAVRFEAAEDVDLRAEHGERRIANGDRKSDDRAVTATVGRRDDLGIHRRSVVAADEVHRVTDGHRARVGARARERATRDRRTSSLDLDRSGRGRGAAADHENAPAELRYRRVVSRLKELPVRRESSVSRIENLHGGGRRGTGVEATEDEEAVRPGPRHHHLAAEGRGELPRKQAGLDGGWPHRRNRRCVRPGLCARRLVLVPRSKREGEHDRNDHYDHKQHEPRLPSAAPSRPRSRRRPRPRAHRANPWNQGSASEYAASAVTRPARRAKSTAAIRYPRPSTRNVASATSWRPTRSA